MDDVVASILEKSATNDSKYKSITVNKLLDVEYDVGALLVFDTNDLNGKLLSGNRNDYLLNLTRDNTQLLLNKIWELPTERQEESIVVKLPPQRIVLPRAKPVPKPRPLTKWQEFAKLKGIQKKKKSKLSWDEQLQKWVPLYGYKRALADKQKNWVLEVPQNSDPLEDQFAKKNVAKGERIAKNELQRLRNIAKARNVKVPRVGLLNPEVSSAKDLQAAVTVARQSTASLGKFQDRLPKEKEAKGISAITPGASRKRKLPPVTPAQEQAKNLEIVESVLSKRPKIIDTTSVAERPQESRREKKSGKKSSHPKSSKKPKGGRVQKKGKGNTGRKRR